jgi:hypothetical protein
MDWDNYVALLTRADSAMRVKQDRLERDFRLGKYKRYDYDEGLGVIAFSDSDVVKVIADVQFVGDVSRRDSTWRWAWDLPYVMPEFAEASIKARRFGQWRGVPPLKTTGWNGDRTDGWEMTSLTAWIAGADGAYSAPSSDSSTYTFLLLRNVRWAPPGKRVSDYIKSRRAARSNEELKPTATPSSLVE